MPDPLNRGTSFLNHLLSQSVRQPHVYCSLISTYNTFAYLPIRNNPNTNAPSVSDAVTSEQVMKRELVLLRTEDFPYWRMLDLAIDLGNCSHRNVSRRAGGRCSRSSLLFLRVCSSQGKFVAEIWRHWNFITSLSLDTKLGVPGVPELPMIGGSLHQFRTQGIFFLLWGSAGWLLRYCIKQCNKGRSVQMLSCVAGCFKG